LCVDAPQTNQPLRAVLAGRQGTEMSAHIAHATASGKGCPLLRNRIVEALLTMDRTVGAPDRLANVRS
jgi:hypothetical protein